MPIQRYRLRRCKSCEFNAERCEVVASLLGKYVLYTDYERVVKVLAEALKDVRKRLLRGALHQGIDDPIDAALKEAGGE